MLITLSIADYKIANHYTDPTATYVSSLQMSSFSTKKGIAADTFKLTLEKEVFDSLNESFTYLCYSTPIDLYIDNKLFIKGYVDKLNTSAKNTVDIDVVSVMQWQLQQFVSPAIEGLCQNQVYSENCTMNKDDFDYNFTTVDIDCFTGAVSLDTLGGVATLGGNDGSGNALFLDRAMWWNAFVLINGKYKAQVVNVTDDKIYLGINYLDLAITTESLTVYLKCDKTYGNCFTRFANTKNFWGFANTGRTVSTIDVFSASNLDYCGEDLVNQEFEYCDTDFSIFGISLTETSGDI